jgi:uncharacterized protein YciI
MFIVLLRFGENKSQAGAHMEGHKAWIKRGFDEGIFLLVASLRPEGGGAILAHNIARGDLEKLVESDPFVAKEIVKADILELAPGEADRRLRFLLPQN